MMRHAEYKVCLKYIISQILQLALITQLCVCMDLIHFYPTKYFKTKRKEILINPPNFLPMTYVGQGNYPTCYLLHNFQHFNP